MPRRLTALGPRHHAAIRRKLDGASGTEIAQAVGVERRTVYLWMGDPLVKEELERQLLRVHDEVAARLAAGAVVALEQLVAIVERPLNRDPDPMERIAAAREILDRYEQLRGERETSRLRQPALGSGGYVISRAMPGRVAD